MIPALRQRIAAALMPPERIMPSGWAEKYRVLRRGQSPRPGPWRNANAPYLRAIMDLCAVPGVEQLNIIKAGQIGVSEAIRNVIGWAAQNDPDPCGITLPNQTKGRQIVDNRLLPMFRHTAPLRALLTPNGYDLTKSQIKLDNGFILHLMWAGSAAATASDPIKRVFNDEVDKFSLWTGRESHPVENTRTRMRAYRDRGAIQINVSTPTNRLGKIHELFEESSLRVHFMIACPHCGARQSLVLARMKFQGYGSLTREEWADRVRTECAAWYECSTCAGKITEEQRAAAVPSGLYMPEHGKVLDAWGNEHESIETVTAFPAGTRIGLHVNAFACLWESLPSLAGAFILAQGNLAGMYSFRTETLGEPFEQTTARTDEGLYATKSGKSKLQEGIVPWWASKLLATVDTQHTHFWVVVRAWGPGMISQRVWHGRVETFDELDALLLRRPWVNEDDTRPPMFPELVLIDTGGTRLEDEKASRTMEVYRWCIPRRARVRPIKGATRPRDGLFIWAGRGWIDRGSSRSRRSHHASDAIRIWHVDSHHFGDELADLVVRDEPLPEGTPHAELYQEPWKLNARFDKEYNQHLSGAIKVLVRRGTALHEEWVPISHGTRIDLWDCEVYQVAAAYMAQVHTLPPLKQLEELRAAAEAARPITPQGGTPWRPQPFRL